MQQSRSGFGISLGLGNGSAGVTCKGCEEFEEDRLNGISGYLRLGAYTSPRFFVGVEGTGWMKNGNGLERRIAALSVVFLGYPSSTGGFFVRSGAGVIRAVVENPSVVAAEERRHDVAPERANRPPQWGRRAGRCAYDAWGPSANLRAHLTPEVSCGVNSPANIEGATCVTRLPGGNQDAGRTDSFNDSSVSVIG